MTILVHAASATPGIVSLLYSETHPEEQTGYREWARRNDGLGDIHGIDDRYDHGVDELTAQHLAT
jgi:hypothetical protein